MQGMLPPTGQEFVFRRGGAGTTSAALLLIGGCVALAFAIVGFAVAVFAKMDAISRQLVTTMPALIGIGALWAGFRSVQSPVEVVVGPQGLRLTGSKGTRSYGWHDVGWSTIQAIPLSGRRQLTLFDDQGKVIAKVSDAIEGFDALADMVARHLATKRDGTTERVQSSKARRNGVVMGLCSVLLLSVAVANVVMAREEQRTAQRLRTEAVPGTGRVVRRFLAPNGVTPRLEYEVRASNGRTGTRNAEVERAYWEELAGAKTVPVVYVPDEPGISRLQRGEAKEGDGEGSPALMYVLSALVGALSIAGLVGAVLSWRGWDIDLDSKTGKVSIKRYGTGR